MKAAVIFLCLIGISQPALAQSLFDGFGGAQNPAQPAPKAVNREEQKWKQLVAQQVRERTPRLPLGPGYVSVEFYVNSNGRVSDLKLVRYETKAQALVIAGAISSLRLPPPPPSLGSGCWFAQSVRFH